MDGGQGYSESEATQMHKEYLAGKMNPPCPRCGKLVKVIVTPMDGKTLFWFKCIFPACQRVAHHYVPTDATPS